MVAEDFEPLMIETCSLRNQQDKAIDWYLIKSLITEDKLHIFQIMSGPAIDIQAEKTDIEYSDFWIPIRENGLFSGKPVRKGDSWITKGVKSAGIDLVVNNSNSMVKLSYRGDDHVDKRDSAYEILAELDYEMVKHNSDKYSYVIFPVMDKGMKHIKHWDKIREKLMKIGTDVYNMIYKSDI